MIKSQFEICCLLLAWILAAAHAAVAAPFELRDGDRIVLVGNALIEREQHHGYLETLIAAAHPDLDLTWRNLGWSGDTVFGESRGGFETAKEGFERLVAKVTEARPTVIIVGYGGNESFEGEAGLAKFRTGMNRLLDQFKPLKARIILLSPTPDENVSAFIPAATNNEKNLNLYGDAIEKIARDREARFVDLMEGLKRQPSERGETNARLLTDDGMHFNEHGYLRFASAVGKSLELLPSKNSETEERLKALEPLRQAVIRKDRLFFHRWRPQNETYLFGHRKHEQGQNAAEVPKFDPLIEQAEKEIARLRGEISR